MGEATKIITGNLRGRLDNFGVIEREMSNASWAEHDMFGD